MGVMGSGKSTVAEALARELNLPCMDADAYHPPENREKMARDEPLTDEDRLPWLQGLASRLKEWSKDGDGCVLACSALKENYRQVLRKGAPHLRIVYLQADVVVLKQRLEARRGRHGIISEYEGMLEGQLRDLEPPAAEDAVALPITLPVEEIVARAAAALRTGHTGTDT